MPVEKTKTNLNITDDALDLCDRLRLKSGLSRSSVIELAVREYAVNRGLIDAAGLASIAAPVAASDR
jgi:hypothetical protein